MKTSKTVLSLVCFFTVLISCFSAQNQEVSDLQLQRKWMLVSFRNYPKEEFIKAKASLDFSQKNKNSAYGNVGCNNLIFSFKTLKNNFIQFKGTATTEMYCEGKMELEDSFVKALSEVTKDRIDGHFLKLYDAKGNEMKFVASDWD